MLIKRLERKTHTVIHVFAEQLYYEYRIYKRDKEFHLDAIYFSNYDDVKTLDVIRIHLSKRAAFNHAQEIITRDITGAKDHECKILQIQSNK